MGLDAVELVMRVEDEFGIAIPDDEAGSVRTVDDLYRIVLSKLDLTPACLSSKAFYRTRQALMASLQVPRRSIRPSSDLESLLPLSSRRDKWDEIAQRLALDFPRLRYSSVWRQCFFWIGALISAVVVLCLGILVERAFGGFVTSGEIWVPGFVIWIIFTAGLNSLINRSALSLQTELPCQTAGDLSRMVLVSNHEHFSPATGQDTVLSKDYVWAKLVAIICDQLGLEREEVVPSARFVEDLGVD